MITSKNIKNHELIGLKTKIIEAKNRSEIGLEGKIIDETKNMIVIETKKGEKKILKKYAKFRIWLETETVDVSGDVLVGRPEERLKK